MRDILLRVILETEVLVTGCGVHVSRKLVLDSLPRREVGRILVTVLPDGPPRLEHGSRRGGADLGWSCEPLLQNAPDHQSVRLRVESVELSGYMRLGANVRGRLIRHLVNDVVMVRMIGRCVVVFGRRVTWGFLGRGTEQDDFRKGRKRNRVIVIGVVVVVVIVDGRLRFRLVVVVVVDDHGWWDQIMMMRMKEIVFSFVWIHEQRAKSRMMKEEKVAAAAVS